MDCARGEGSPPPELLFYWWYGAGTVDEDYRLVHRAAIAGNVYNTVKRYTDLKGAAIHTLTTGERRVLADLRDMGLL